MRPLTGEEDVHPEEPGEGTREAFWVIVGALLVVSAATLGFFRWRGWL